MTAHTAEKTPPPDEELALLKETLQRRLEQLLPAGSQRDLVSAAMREGTLTPGKRIRPLLLILTARNLGCDAHHPGLLDLPDSLHTAARLHVATFLCPSDSTEPASDAST